MVGLHAWKSSRYEVWQVRCLTWVCGVLVGLAMHVTAIDLVDAPSRANRSRFEDELIEGSDDGLSAAR